MNIKLIIILIAIFLIGCRLKDSSKGYYYIIKTNFNKPDSSKVPRPPVTFYGYLNFILINDTESYYFKSVPYNNCITYGNLRRPPEIKLMPLRVSSVSKNAIAEVLRKSINEARIPNEPYFLSISSPKDTIRNDAYKIIVDYLMQKHIDTYIIRSMTEEEKCVMKSITTRTNYNRDSIEWQIGFDGKEFRENLN